MANTAAKQVFLLRHAENERGGNVTDPPLSAEGRRQAQEMGRFIGQQPLRTPLLIVSSFLARGFETASIIDESLPVELRRSTHILPVHFLHESEFEGLISLTMPFIARLDNLQSHIIRYPDPAPVGTLVMVGHRRSMALDFMEMVLDPKTAIARAEALDRGEGELWPDYPYAYVTQWRLNAERWADITKRDDFATKVAERSFRGELTTGPFPAPG